MPPRPHSRRLVVLALAALGLASCRDLEPTAPASRERPRLAWYPSLDDAPIATDVSIHIPDKPPGAWWFVGVAMNDAQEVAGYIYPGDGQQFAIRWRPTTGTTFLGTMGDPDQRCLASAINELGTMAGVCITSEAPFGVQAWMGPPMNALTPPGGSATVNALSNAHVAVGAHGSTPASPRAAFRFAGGLQILPPDPGIQPDEEYEAYDVNDDGTAIGGRHSLEFPARHVALRWAAGPAGALAADVLPLGDMFVSALARSIDVGGNVYGEAWTEDGHQHFVKWSPDGTIEDLTPEGPVGTCFINDANDAGILVGWCLPSGGPVPFRWTPVVGLERLDVAPYAHGEAYDIRNDGSILGYVQEPNGAEPSYRLVRWLPGAPVNNAPVPVPGGPYTGREGAGIAFDGRLSYDPDGEAITYDWDFGDGTPHGTSALASHVYANDGMYTATLTVRDLRGRSAAVSTEVRVADVAPSVTRLRFALPWIVAPPAGMGWHFDFTFADAGSADGPYAWRVDWGDGSTPTTGSRATPGMVTPAHTYGAPGRRTVTIRITDRDGRAGTRSFPVSVR